MSAPPPRIRCAVSGLLSDCDGVIVDSEGVAEAALAEGLQGIFGRAPVEAAMRALFGQRIADIIAALEHRSGIVLADDVRRALQHRIDDHVAEHALAMPGTCETYAALGVPVAIVSNSAPARLQRSVERSGLLPLAGRHVYSAEAVGRPKPAPDGYLHAARQLGLEPADCLVIEDSPTGVRAARAAGMAVLGYLGGSHIAPGHGEALRRIGAHAVFDRMDALPALVDLLRTEGLPP